MPGHTPPRVDGARTFGRTVRAVAWAFLGLRKSSGFEQDVKLNPLHIVAAGLAGAALFVLGLMALVHWVA